MMKRYTKILLVTATAILCLLSCRTEYYPAAGYNQLYGGAEALYEWQLDVFSIYTFKGIRL